MAKMIPDMPSEDIANEGERLVYQALKEQLPDDWVVRYHYPACWKVGSYLKDFEVDFIVVAPSKGLLFLEVKSSFGFECSEAAWYRVKKNGKREKTRSPLDQVSGTMHRVVEKVSDKIFGCEKYDFPGIYGHLVIYPKGKLMGSQPGSVASDTVATRKDMENLSKLIPSTFNLWGPPEQGHKFSHTKMKRIVDFFEDNCRYIQVFASDVDEDENCIEELTRKQFEAFKHLLSFPRVVVSGPAGSGKTMIAQWIAGEYHQQGKNVLLLCYNRVLEAWIKQSIPENSFEVRSFSSICRERIIAAGESFNLPTGTKAINEFWTQEAPDRLFSALTETADEEKYDVILVDEAQDFHEDWWMSVQLLLRDPDQGGLYMFRDPNQAGVYGHGTMYPSANVYEVPLTENCRNTKLINSYCSHVIESNIASAVKSPEGVIPEINEALSDGSLRAQAVKRAVNKLLSDGFCVSQIAILSPYSSKHKLSILNRLDSISNIKVRGGDAAIESWKDGETIWGSTIKSFKGLEADCVIISDLHLIGDHFTQSDLYVACSRAKHKLFLFPIIPEGAEYLRAHLGEKIPQQSSKR
jgi:hypothetical protein